MYSPPYNPYLQSIKFTIYRMIGPLTYLSSLLDWQPHAPGILKSAHNSLFRSAIVTSINKVALWSHHPYIAPFYQLPHNVIGAPSLHFPIHSHPRDLDPAIYTFTFLGLSFALVPDGALFSCHVQVQMLTFSFIE
jgi:hypothetical protein